MKIVKFIIGFVLLLSNSLSAIEIVSVDPERPAVGNEVFLNIFFTGEEQAADARIQSIAVENNQIEVVATISDGISVVTPPDKTESFSLGELPAGDYLVSLSVLALFGSPSSPSVVQTFPFSVSGSNSIPTLGEYSMLLGLVVYRSYTKKY